MESSKHLSEPVKITVAGMINDPDFQKCVAAVEHLQSENYGVVTCECQGFFETQWEEYLKKTANRLKGVFYEHQSSPLIFLNDAEYVGDADRFMEYALHTFAYQDNQTSEVYKQKANMAYDKIINESKTRKYASMEFRTHSTKHAVVFELFADIAPRTVQNFLTLCKGFKKEDGEELSYTDSEVGRIVKGMFVQCGRIKPNKNPQNGVSSVGGEFADESFHVKHTEIGLVGMCKRNGHKHSNESQFYITTGAPLSFMDGENVVFGRVIEGMKGVFELEGIETINEKPSEPVSISQSGQYTRGK